MEELDCFFNLKPNMPKNAVWQHGCVVFHKMNNGRLYPRFIRYVDTLFFGGKRNAIPQEHGLELPPTE